MVYNSEKTMQDLIVIGAGPAGLTAGLYAGLYGLQTRVIGETIGGALKLAPMIFDYPGVKAIKGSDWLDAILFQLKEAGAEIIEKKITAISRNDQGSFKVNAQDEMFETLSLIFASGNEKRRPQYSGSDLAKSLGIELTQENFILVDEKMRTNIPGIYAAGNCLQYPLGAEQLIDAAAQGARTAAQVYEYLKGKKAPLLWGKATIPNL